jgi:hypothetical protein
VAYYSFSIWKSSLKSVVGAHIVFARRWGVICGSESGILLP